MIEDIGLNNSFELILIEDLNDDIKPISRLAAYLCLRYHIQAMVKPTWGDTRPVGFYDLLRNIFIVTDENDSSGLMTLELRVYLAPPTDRRLRMGKMLPIPEVPLEEVGAAWYVERAIIGMQMEQLLYHDEVNYNTDIDWEHPFIKAFEQIGLHVNPNADPVEMIPGNLPVTIDSAVQTFLAHKPGAKRNPLSEL